MYQKFEENIDYRECEKISSTSRLEYAPKANYKIWPWATAITTLVLISILSLTLVSSVLLMSLELNSVRAPAPTQERVLSCYYSPPSDNSSGALQPESVPARPCSHLNVGFASVRACAVQLPAALRAALRRLRVLKLTNPALKLLLSVGGAGEHNGFSEMVSNHANRKIFIKSIKEVLKDNELDGIDLDWEFPVLHNQRGASARERMHFSQLLREIRMEYLRERKNYILSVALAAPQTIADVAYDVDQINLYVDYANIMTYDFHYYTKFTPFTGFNSPLYARASEELFMATLNINHTVSMYRSKGLDRDKIVVGIPTYAHSFRLVNPENAGVGSPSSGFGAVGARGFADYPAVCAFAAGPPRAAPRWDAAARVPYLARGPEWLSYDSPRSVREKAAFVRRLGLRGAMIYSLNADDHGGRCGADDGAPPGDFPLVRSVADELHR